MEIYLIITERNSSCIKNNSPVWTVIIASEIIIFREDSQRRPKLFRKVTRKFHEAPFAKS